MSRMTRIDPQGRLRGLPEDAPSTPPAMIGDTPRELMLFALGVFLLIGVYVLLFILILPLLPQASG